LCQSQQHKPCWVFNIENWRCIHSWGLNKPKGVTRGITAKASTTSRAAGQRQEADEFLFPPSVYSGLALALHDFNMEPLLSLKDFMHYKVLNIFWRIILLFPVKSQAAGSYSFCFACSCHRDKHVQYESLCVFCLPCTWAQRVLKVLGQIRTAEFGLTHGAYTPFVEFILPKFLSASGLFRVGCSLSCHLFTCFQLLWLWHISNHSPSLSPPMSLYSNWLILDSFLFHTQLLYF
jgi:hypothetical protein